MVEKFCPATKYDPICDRHVAWCEPDTDGDYVLATDYAALEAERDEWKRRLDTVVKMLEPGPEHPKWGHAICESCGWHGCFSSFVGRAGGELEDDDDALCPLCQDSVQDVCRSIYVNLHARAIAITEGRDNG